MATTTDAQIKRALQNVVKDARKNKEDITVKRARARVETLLDLEEGFFKHDDDWRARSKEIINDAFYEEEKEDKERAKKHTVKDTPKTKPVAPTSERKLEKAAKRKAQQPQESKQKDSVTPAAPQKRSQKDDAKTAQPVVTSSKIAEPTSAKPAEAEATTGDASDVDEGSGGELGSESEGSEKPSETQPTPTPKRPDKTVPAVNGVKRKAGEQSADDGVGMRSTLRNAVPEQPQNKKARTDEPGQHKRRSAEEDDDASSQSSSGETDDHDDGQEASDSPKAIINQSVNSSKWNDTENNDNQHTGDGEGLQSDSDDPGDEAGDHQTQSKTSTPHSKKTAKGAETENNGDSESEHADDSRSDSDGSENQGVDQQAQTAPKASPEQTATSSKREVVETNADTRSEDADSDDGESTSDGDSHEGRQKKTSVGSRSASPDVPNGATAIHNQEAASGDGEEVGSDDEDEDEDEDDESGDEDPAAAKAVEDKGKRKADASSAQTPLQPSQAGLAAVAPKLFKPPAGYNALDSAQLQRNETFTSTHLEGKQIWHITAPSNLPLSSINEVAFDAIQSGQPILTHKGTEYVLNEARTNLHDRATLLLPSTEGYRRFEHPIERSLQIQQKISRPDLSIRQASQSMGSAAAADVAEPAVIAVRPQLKGLRMRYKPPGFGTGKPGMIGSESDSEMDEAGEQPSSRATFQFPRALGAYGTSLEETAGGAGTTADVEEATTKKVKKKRKSSDKVDDPTRLVKGTSASPEADAASPAVVTNKAPSPVLTNGIASKDSGEQDRAKRKEEKRLKKERKEAKRKAQVDVS